MRKYVAGAGVGLSILLLAVSPPAMASTYIGPQDTSVDWAQEFCLTDCSSTPTSSPITQIDIVMATAGITFTGSALYTDINETSLDAAATATYGLNGGTQAVISFSPADNVDAYLTLNFSPLDTSTPFTFYWEQWSGSQFIATSSSVTSSDVVSWTGSTWAITPMTEPVSVTSLPPAAALFASGLESSSVSWATGAKRRTKADSNRAYQFA